MQLKQLLISLFYSRKVVPASKVYSSFVTFCCSFLFLFCCLPNHQKICDNKWEILIISVFYWFSLFFILNVILKFLLGAASRRVSWSQTLGSHKVLLSSSLTISSFPSLTFHSLFHHFPTYSIVWKLLFSLKKLSCVVTLAFQ